LIFFGSAECKKNEPECLLNEKALTVLLCVLGILAVFYGMLKDNNLIFIIGILFIVGGYLLIRRKLKASIQDKFK
jgi:LPXTG-motif cell wall-anchored protein